MFKMLNNLMPAEPLEGERVTLAFLEPEDSEELLYLVNSSRESLGEWLPWVENFHSMRDAYAMIESYMMQREMGNGGAFGIRRHEDGALIGEVILQWIDERNRSASFGFFLGCEFEGEGYATEAMVLAMAYAASLGIHRLEVSVAENNEKSNNLASRLGFALEGLAKDAEFLHGEFVSHNRYGFVLTSNNSFY